MKNPLHASLLFALLLGLPVAHGQMVEVSGDVSPVPNPNPFSGGVWNIPEMTALLVGDSGTGELWISDGASVYSSGWGGTAGYQAGSSGSITVTGANSKLDFSGSGGLYVGHQGTGSLTVSDGGSVFASYSMIGDDFGSVGSVTVTGAGSQWNMAQGLTAGHYSKGELLISDGGSVSSLWGSIGSDSYAAQGKVTVTGEGSKWDTSGNMTIGGWGWGELIIKDGAQVQVGGMTRLDGAGTMAAIHLDNGTLQTGLFLGSADQLSGTGVINTAGLLADVDLVFDKNHGLQQQIVLDGEGQNITVNLDTTGGNQWMGAGAWGRGTLTVTDGVILQSTAGYVGFNEDSTGIVTISGEGSQWNNSESLTVGYHGTGELTVKDGGRLSSVGGSIVSQRDLIGAAVVTVTGANSKWDNTGALSVGGVLNVSNGGHVSNTNGSIGYNLAAEGKATISGAGSRWTNSGNLIVGGNSLTVGTAAKGVLNIKEGGAVTVGGTLKIWSGGSIVLEVYGNSGIEVGGDLSNDGLIRLVATPNLAAGVYTPISVTGEWAGSGSYEAVGGIWNASTHQFTVAAAQGTSSGTSTTVDLEATQRLEISGSSSSVMVAFAAGGQSSGGSSSITFSATENKVEQISGGGVLSAWNFETDLIFEEVQLSLEIGTGWDPSQLSVWHSDDGIHWTPFETQIVYVNNVASFYVNGFSSYAVTMGSIPEPSTVFLVSVGLAGLFLRRSRRNG